MLPIFSRLFSAKDSTYQLLPTTSHLNDENHQSQNGHTAYHPPPTSLKDVLTSRPVRRSGPFFLALFLILAVHGVKTYLERYHGLPDYKEIRAYEKRLPQHKMNLPWPEGKNGRFLRFSTPYHYIGFNNQLQDIIMSAQLSYMSNRAYVFQPYMWNTRSWKPVQLDGNHYRSNWIPLNAFLSGPAAGGPFGPGTGTTKSGERAPWEAPRSVSYDWYDEVCPPNRRVYLDIDELRTHLGLVESDRGPANNTKEMLVGLSRYLREMDDNCVTLTGDHVFTFSAFSDRILPTWDLLQESPVLNNFSWSPLVRGIVARNMRLLADVSRWDLPPTAPTTSIPGLLAIHLRRGDFIDHCDNLNHWASVWSGWNSFPGYRDNFFTLAQAASMTYEERLPYFQQHCLPSVDQLVSRLNVVRREWELGGQSGERKLKRAYLLTNAEPEYKKELKERLLADGWEHVAMTSDLSVEQPEVEVDVAADMMIGQYAEVFVGNGFSSLTANINLLRLGRKVHMDSIRFL
ncbi:hypothetical protein FS837_008964 [Tulasnella sp. UAMH 9824]|nr:hypothetical protein FS837_008964 [Tulasnella sp. UAMH 9824]